MFSTSNPLQHCPHFAGFFIASERLDLDTVKSTSKIIAVLLLLAVVVQCNTPWGNGSDAPTGEPNSQAHQSATEGNALLAITAKNGSPLPPIQPNGPGRWVSSAISSGWDQPWAISTSAT